MIEDDCPPDPEKDAIFVDRYLKTGDALDAHNVARYMINGYDPRIVAEYLIIRPDIKLAIASAEKIKNQVIVDITRESTISDLEYVYRSSLVVGEYGHAISAKKLQAQMSGLLVDNVQVTHRVDVKQMTDEQLMAMLERRQKINDAKMIDVTPVGLGSISDAK